MYHESTAVDVDGDDFDCEHFAGDLFDLCDLFPLESCKFILLFCVHNQGVIFF